MTAGHQALVLNAEYTEWLADAGMMPVVLPSLPGSEDQALEGLSAPGPVGRRGHPAPALRRGPRAAPRGEVLPPGALGLRIRPRVALHAPGHAPPGNLPGLPDHQHSLGRGSDPAPGGPPVPSPPRQRPGRPRRATGCTSAPGTLVAALYPSPDTRVVSSHHQALGRHRAGLEDHRVGARRGGRVHREPLLSPRPGRPMAPRAHAPVAALGPNLAAWLKSQAAGLRQAPAGSG